MPLEFPALIAEAFVEGEPPACAAPAVVLAAVALPAESSIPFIAAMTAFSFAFTTLQSFWLVFCFSSANGSTPICLSVAIVFASMFASAMTSDAHWFIIASLFRRFGAAIPYFCRIVSAFALSCLLVVAMSSREKPASSREMPASLNSF